MCKDPADQDTKTYPPVPSNVDDGIGEEKTENPQLDDEIGEGDSESHIITGDLEVTPEPPEEDKS